MTSLYIVKYIYITLNDLTYIIIMSVKVPEIYWHGNKERIMSIDFQPESNYLITGGSDSEF
jgi:hypothetical protein